MADELDLDTLDESINKENKVETRIKDLSNKVKTASDERDANAKAKTEAEARAVSAEKERDFFSSFSDVVGQYPQAKDFKDKIKEKVMAGYSPEDATVSVLAKEGKLTQNMPEKQTVAGGSAINQPQNGAPKGLHEMSQAEKRAALVEEEKKGNIGLS